MPRSLNPIRARARLRRVEALAVTRTELGISVARVAVTLGDASDRAAAEVCSGARPMDLGELTELDARATVVLLRELLARHAHADHPVIALVRSQLVTAAQLAALAV
jgi:hypothetical protein